MTPEQNIAMCNYVDLVAAKLDSNAVCWNPSDVRNVLDAAGKTRDDLRLDCERLQKSRDAAGVTAGERNITPPPGKVFGIPG